MIVAFDVSQVVYGTGVSVYIKNLIKAFSLINQNSISFKFFGFSRGHFNYLKKIKEEYRNEPRFKFYFFPFPEKIRDLSLQLRLNPSFLIGKYDLLHIPDWVGYYSTKPTIATVHDLAIYHYPDTFPHSIISHQSHYLNWIANKASHLICVSKTTQSDLHRFYPKTQNKTTVIYEANPFEFDTPANWDKVSHTYSLRTNQKYFITIATLEPRKNLNRIIQAFVQAKLPNYQLFIAGKIGWGKDIRIKHPAVRFLGYTPTSELISLLQHAQALLYPSLWEGFGLPIAAAASYQIPVLTSNQGVMKEIAPKDSLLVNPLNIPEISRAIIKLSQLTKKPKQTPSSFSWLKTGQETLSLYHQVLTS